MPARRHWLLPQLCIARLKQWIAKVVQCELQNCHLDCKLPDTVASVQLKYFFSAAVFGSTNESLYLLSVSAYCPGGFLRQHSSISVDTAYCFLSLFFCDKSGQAA